MSQPSITVATILDFSAILVPLEAHRSTTGGKDCSRTYVEMLVGEITRMYVRVCFCECGQTWSTVGAKHVR